MLTLIIVFLFVTSVARIVNGVCYLVIRSIRGGFSPIFLPVVRMSSGDY